jgi:hypothetical protein
VFNRKDLSACGGWFFEDIPIQRMIPFAYNFQSGVFFILLVKPFDLLQKELLYFFLEKRDDAG